MTLLEAFKLGDHIFGGLLLDRRDMAPKESAG
jgi:hypothetical protein